MTERIGTMDPAYFASRGELLGWLKNALGYEYKQVEQCGTGVPYIAMLPSLFGPSMMNVVHKAKLCPKQEYEYMINFKLIQDAFTKNGVDKVIDVQRLARGNYQGNLEFLQWFKRFCDQRGVAIADEVTRQIIADASSTSPAPSHQHASAAKPATNRRVTTAKPPQVGGIPSSKSSVQDVSAAACPAASPAAIPEVELERRFYFDKLRSIEIMVGNVLLETERKGSPQLTAVELAKQIQTLLYQPGR